MGFPLLILLACAFAGWAMLSAIGFERQRRLDDLEAERHAAATAAAEAALKAARAASLPIVVGSPKAPAARQSPR